MKLATTTGDFFSYTNDQAEALRHIRAAGFKYADYSFECDYTSHSGIFSDGYSSHVEKIKAVMDEEGITLVQAHAPMGSPLDPSGDLLSATLLCVDACGAWGIPNIVVHSGYEKGLSREETLEKNKEFFLPILRRAEKYGVNVLVENFNKMGDEGIYWIDNAPDLLAIIEYVDHPLFHAVWDVGHANMQSMPEDEALRMLSSHVKALHIQDNNGDRDSHLAPFLGTLNMDSVMCGLSDIGYDGYFTFEVGRFFARPETRRKYGRSTKLASAPIELRDAFERYLYDLGKCVLTTYGVYEE